MKHPRFNISLYVLVPIIFGGIALLSVITTHQILKYTFDNVDLDFLPGGWLAQLDELRATMSMGQPFEGVWLPSTVEMQAAGQIAIGAIEFRYRLEYTNYQEAKTGGRIIGVAAP